MAAYIKATDFAAKDSLLSGDPLKIVSGTEIDDEYNAIQTAINSKANTNSPTLTGSPTAPTATAGTNTAQLSTTAFVTSAINTAVAATKEALYPVGSIYTNAVNATNPATLLGFGTWTAFGAGRVMVGFNAADPLFDTAQETGGSKDAVLVSHTHTATSTVTDPGHSHIIPAGNDDGTATTNIDQAQNFTNNESTGSATTGITVATTNSTEGVSATNANLQPYITVYMWRRTA